MKVKKVAILLTSAVVTMATLTACNRNCMDGCSSSTLTFKYIVIEENGHSVRHEVKSWSDSESDGLTVTTSCCDNYIWTSANKANIYRDEPPAYAYDLVCSGKNTTVSADAKTTHNHVHYDAHEVIDL